MQPNSQIEVELTPTGLGRSLLHCHNQLHMDYGFMTFMDCT